jgi:hypothetical protein
VDGQLLALSPHPAEARAGFGDWMRGSECRDAEQRQGHPRADDPHHQSWRLEVMRCFAMVAIVCYLLVLLLAASPVDSLDATNGIYPKHHLCSAEYRSIVYVHSAIDI